MRYKAVIFDVDGTLLDSIKSYQTAFNRGTATFGLPPVEAKDLAECLSIGMTLEEVICRLHPGHDDEVFVRACRQEIFAAFLALADDPALLLPDVALVLRGLKALGINMGIATGRTSPSSRVQESFRRLRIDHYFDAVVTAADAERKPAPDTIVECARQLGVDPADCLFVGDAVADVQAGKAAGATVVAVLTGVSTEAMIAPYGPDKICGRLSDVLELFEGDD